MKRLLHEFLRFMNVDQPENGEKEDCVEKVGKIIEDLGCGVGANDIDRTHRIGRITTTAFHFIFISFHLGRVALQERLIFKGLSIKNDYSNNQE